MDASNNRTAMLIALAMLFFFLVPGINHGLWRPDEPRVAGTCAEMARTCDYFIPHLNGKPFLEKPPLYYALGSLSGSLFGMDSDVPYRLVSLLFALLTILVTFALASWTDGPVTGMAAGGILMSTWGFFMLARWVQVDIALVFGITLAMYASMRLADLGRSTDSIILGLAVGIAFMAKGPVGPAIIAAAILMDAVRSRDPGLLWRIRPFTIAAFTVAIVLPWVLVLWSRGGWPFLREVFVVNHLLRFTGAPEAAALGHQKGALYYFTSFPSGFLPWTLVFIPAVIAGFRRFRDDPYLGWLMGPFILLSLASTKRGLYLVPLYPAAACITARWLVNRCEGVAWEAVLVKITRGVAVAACFLPFAGIFLGLPVLGTVMGLVAVTSLLLLSRWVKVPGALSLVALVCVALFALSSVYFAYGKPGRDYLQFARNALAAAGGREVTIIGNDEVMRGVFPMVSGRTFTVGNATDVLKEGLYVWTDKRGHNLKEVSRHAAVKILYEKRIDISGNRIGCLAYVTPRISKSSEFSVTAVKAPSGPEFEPVEEGRGGF